MSEGTSTPETLSRSSAESIAHTSASTPVRALSALPEVVLAEDDDFEVPVGQMDPYMTECPEWCMSVDVGHHMVVVEEDRVHASPAARIALRYLPATWYQPTNSFVLAHAEVYLAHQMNQAAPTVRVQLNDTVGRVDLALDEAAMIARTLLTMVEAAR